MGGWGGRTGGTDHVEGGIGHREDPSLLHWQVSPDFRRAFLDSSVNKQWKEAGVGSGPSSGKMPSCLFTDTSHIRGERQ